MTETTLSLKSDGRLERLFEAGHFVVTGELGPPKSVDPNLIKQKAQYLKNNVDGLPL